MHHIWVQRHATRVFLDGRVEMTDDPRAHLLLGRRSENFIPFISVADHEPEVYMPQGRSTPVHYTRRLSRPFRFHPLPLVALGTIRSSSLPEPLLTNFNCRRRRRKRTRHWQPSRHARPTPGRPSSRAGVVVTSHRALTRPPHGSYVPPRRQANPSWSCMTRMRWSGQGRLFLLLVQSVRHGLV